MATEQLLEIQPKELTFIFELKKQSSCAVRLTNNTYHNVAFKVKTTSPKKYCVRPNVGIISPKSTREFTVTMQAPKSVPVEMASKDKFLIQSTVVPVGTTDEDITPDMFIKDESKHIEEVKLRVALISPPESPVLSPINGVLNQGSQSVLSVMKDPVMNLSENKAPSRSVAKNVEFKMIYDQESKTIKKVELLSKKDGNDSKELEAEKDTGLISNIVADNGAELTLTKDADLKPEKDATSSKLAKVEASLPPMNVVKNTFNDELAMELESPVPINEMEVSINGGPAKDAEFSQPKTALKDSINEKLGKEAECSAPENAEKDEEFLVVKPRNELKLVSDIEEMKFKLNILESKLNEAESTISKLTEERRLSVEQTKLLQEELAALKSKESAKKVQVGFPLLFVVMVAIVSIFVGYLSHC